MDDSLDRISFTFNGLDSEEANEEFEKRLKSALAGPHQVAPDDEGAFLDMEQVYTEPADAKRVKSLADRPPG